MKPTVQHTTERTTAADAIDRFVRTRQRTFAALGQVSDADLERVHSPLLSPIVWDLAHIGAFADLWLAEVLGRPLLREDLAVTYDAGETPRAGRGALELLDHAGARDYLARVDDALFAALHTLDFSPDAKDPLLRNGFLIDLLVEHEEQHRETILQTLHLAEPGVHVAGPPAAWAGTTPPGPLMVDVPTGQPQLGAHRGFAYDNEQPRYVAAVPGFRIDRTPVTVGAYREFIDDGGYRDARHWSPEGWAWRQQEGAERPLYWQADGTIRRFDRIEAPTADAPVMNVSWFEADAYARWRGVRLPTEIEWETAARLDATTGITRTQPWGEDPVSRARANIDGEALGALPPSAAGAAPCGALGMIGDVWEWTSSPLQAYPGFRAFPYPEYSEIFFDGPYRVLRGGSWATAACCARSTFRNWDHPQRRQIFAGFRCAADL
ncbi:MAG: ergothioneine biosynthesis protein EgtB [Solirubrobacteraceae bacterium]|nr:ergothioneine biosynthesis protein EgtB [Patulibacter sp.]